MLLKVFLPLFALALVAPTLAHDHHKHTNDTGHHSAAEDFHKPSHGKHFKDHRVPTHKHNGTHGKEKVHEKRGVLNTVGTTDTGDSKWHVMLWNTANCTGRVAEAYQDYVFMSSHCIKNPNKWKSFALKGNLKDCTTFWYSNDNCDDTDPPELSSVMGDVRCSNGPGAPGTEALGSFRITCDGSNGGA